MILKRTMSRFERGNIIDIKILKEKEENEQRNFL